MLAEFGRFYLERYSVIYFIHWATTIQRMKPVGKNRGWFAQLY
jgi:hypothetical protein